MAQNSKIEWTDHTANLWHGCTKVHEGCDHCYAEVLSHRWGNDVWGNNKPRKAIKSVWSDLDKYQKLAAAAGTMHRVFVGSMMDIFEKSMPLIDSKGEKILLEDVKGCYLESGDMRETFLNNIDRGQYPNLMFLLLTKRPSNINKYIPQRWKENPPANVMFGTSPVNQETANKLIGQLMQVKGKRFLSVEPQLDHIDIRAAYSYRNFGSICSSCSGNGYYSDNFKTPCPDCDRTGVNPNPIHWIIQGGESAHGKRPFNIDWAYSMKQQCEVAGVPYFFKQIDKIQPVPEDLLNRQFPSHAA